MKIKDNFFVWWKREGFKAAWKKLKYNYIMLETPRSLINKTLLGYGFSLVGLFVGFILSIIYLKGYLKWVLITIAGAFLIQYSGLKQTLINYNQLKELEKLQKDMEVQEK